MSAPQIIQDLVARFEANTKTYTANRYNETQLRREFLDPFFEALGWDVANRAGYSEAYKDVIHEDALAVEGHSRAPDYAFRVGGRRVFFVEAKKPAVNLNTGVAPAFQLRRYAWTARLPLSILTDFEEFAIYDCRIKPAPTDKPTTARLLRLTYPEYLTRWDELFDRFSKEAVLQGRFDAYAEVSRGKKGAADVDDDFLATIEGWRKALALNLALRNPGLTERDLNFAVQMTIDRILFLRIAEERGIERTDQLKDIAAEGEVYAGLVQLFRLADQRYNSGLFHFGAEKGRSTHADTLTPALAVDDRVLKEIIRGLYYPVCPYAWYVLPAEILGQVYEQFLGRVIRLTPGHQAKVEEKPEVRKAGGVYYTPGYIVDYIVAQTVGRLLDGRTPTEAARVKIVDPACGSGSFLLGAYQYLLNWHLTWYTANHPQSHARGAHPAVFESRQGWALTTDKKKEILLNSIYGVDIDPQAVEVTKLSLLLKVLEGDLPAAETQLGLRLERMLPDLGGNIQCGNSLIGPDYYANRQMGLGLADDAEQYRVNAFDWQRAFPGVFAAGGFDAVIGNPPYVRQETLGASKAYFQAHYQVYHGMADLYAYFIERGYNLLRPGGRFGYIVANKWMRANYGEPLRRWLKARRIEQMIDFGDLPVFEQATTYPCILILEQAPPADEIAVTQVQSLIFNDLSAVQREQSYPLAVGSLQDTGWSLARPAAAALLDKLRTTGQPLGDYVQGKIYRGVVTGYNEAFVIDAATRERLIIEDPRSAEVIVPFLLGREIKRYQTPVPQRYLIFTRRGIDIKKYPAIKKYLEQFKSYLMPRPAGWSEGEWAGRKLGSYQWYEIQDSTDYYPEFEKPKIIYPNICKGPEFTFDTTNQYTNQKCFIISLDDKYLLGILNSRLSMFLFGQLLPKLRGGFYEPNYVVFKNFPIRTINFADPAEAALHSRMVALVEQMLALHARRAAAHNPQELELLARQIETTDQAIDTLVYQLYGLTPEEIKLVEG